LFVVFIASPTLRADDVLLAEPPSIPKTPSRSALAGKPMHLISTHADWKAASDYIDGLIAGSANPEEKEKHLTHQKFMRQQFLAWQQQEQEKINLITDPVEKKKLSTEMKLTAILCVITIAVSGFGEREVLIQAYRGYPEVTWQHIAAVGTIGYGTAYDGIIQAKADFYAKWLFDRDYNPFKTAQKLISKPADSWARAEFDIFAKRFIASVPFTVFFNVGQMFSGTKAVATHMDAVGIVWESVVDGGVYTLTSHALWSYAKWIRSVERIPKHTREFRANYVNFALTTAATVAFMLKSGANGNTYLEQTSYWISAGMFYGGMAFFAGSWATERVLRPVGLRMKDFAVKVLEVKKKWIPGKNQQRVEITPKRPLSGNSCGDLFL
jgi:hypothetical protein